MPPLITLGLSSNLDRRFRKNGRGVKQRPVMLAAIHTVTQPDPKRLISCLKADFTAQAATRNLLHAMSPSRIDAINDQAL